MRVRWYSMARDDWSIEWRTFGTGCAIWIEIFLTRYGSILGDFLTVFGRIEYDKMKISHDMVSSWLRYPRNASIFIHLFQSLVFKDWLIINEWNWVFRHKMRNNEQTSTWARESTEKPPKRFFIVAKGFDGNIRYLTFEHTYGATEEARWLVIFFGSVNVYFGG